MKKIPILVILTMLMTEVAYANNVSSSLLNNWTGFYAGANAGFVFNEAKLTSQQLGFTDLSNTCNTTSNFSSFFPGIQAGYMHQFSNYLVLGIEANVTVNVSQTTPLTCTCPTNPDVSDSFSFRNHMQSSIKALLGRTVIWNSNVLLPYLTLGASFANVGLKYSNEGGDYYSSNKTGTGVLIGAGIEWAFMRNWSLRAEYSYINYGNGVQMNIPIIYGLIDPNGSGHVNLSSNNFDIAINYWI